MTEVEKIKLRIDQLEKKGYQNAAIIAKWQRKLRLAEKAEGKGE